MTMTRLQEFEMERRLRIEGNPGEADLVRAANNFHDSFYQNEILLQFQLVGETDNSISSGYSRHAGNCLASKT